MGLATCVLAGCPTDGTCELDADCASDTVCARDHVCTPPNQVRSVRVTWTINGSVASEAACRGEPLAISFRGVRRDDSLGFQPVPCEIGQFSVDKLPIRFTSVELEQQLGVGRASGPLDANGMATLDLRF